MILNPYLSISRDNSSKIRLSCGDRKTFNISTTKASWNCSICNNEIKSGSIVIGSGYLKICLNCVQIKMEKSAFSFQEISHVRFFVEIVLLKDRFFFQLVHEVLEAFDWSGDLRREERSEKSKVDKALNRLAASVDVDYVVDEFKCEKGNTERQEDIQCRAGYFVS